LIPFIQKHWKFFALLTSLGIALRLVFVLRFPVLQGDTLVYAEIARTWLNADVFGFTTNGEARATLIRLPGYPAFVAAIFAIFGQDNFRAVMLVQLIFDICTCFLVTDMTRRLAGEERWRMVLAAFAIAALCPFTANYVGTPLTETLSIFFTAAALDGAIASLRSGQWRGWILSGAATACAILLRPDGGLLLGTIGLYLLWRVFKFREERKWATMAGVLLTVISLAPLIPWAIRNWKTFHVFQPLVTFAATDPGEFTPEGWERWLKTWMIDYVTMEDVAFRVSSDPLEMKFMPPRAFDSEEQRQRVSKLVDAYNVNTSMTPELDSQFGEIARERARSHPLRTYVLIPLARLTSMWFRPRTEMLPIDIYWWHFKEDPHDSAIASALGLLNLVLVAAALWGLVRFRFQYAGLLITFIAVRSVFMMLAGVAEPRYVLECYPVVFVLAAFGTVAVTSTQK
jgi:hypothetical protein